MSAEKTIEEFDGRFRSGNDIPVERIWLSKELYEQKIRPLLEKAAQFERYHGGCFEVGNGTQVKTHINVAVNVWRGEDWLSFHETEPGVFEEILSLAQSYATQESE